MIIGVVGLGLIGGSFAKAYQTAGNVVLATDTDDSILKFAMLSGTVDKELTRDNLKDCDLILVCTYPQAAIEYMEANGPFFGKKPIVIDSCGTKREIVAAGMELAKKHDFTYVGGHPMAGTQYSGFKYSREDMFVNAPMVIVPPVYDDMAFLERVKSLLKPAGFASITVTTADKHDAMIAYTSQLAHVVSSAYIKSPTVREHKGISAGSYKDMTRVAWLNPEMWTQLCLANRENLIKETSILIDSLNDYRTALENDDADELKRLFEEGRRLKEEVDG